MSEIAESVAVEQQRQGSAVLVLVAPPEPRSLTAAERQLRQMVVDAVAAPTTKAAYGHALDQLFAFAHGRPLSRRLLTSGSVAPTPPAKKINRRVRRPVWSTRLRTPSRIWFRVPISRKAAEHRMISATMNRIYVEHYLLLQQCDPRL